MKSQTIFLTHLYPKHMSLYGDWGNVRALEFRLKKKGYDVFIQEVELGESLPEQTDFYFLGGGQDKEQLVIYEDLLIKKDRIINDLEAQVPMLAICGGYQLLGHSFVTGDGSHIEGLKFLPVVTKSPSENRKERCIGNIRISYLVHGLEGVEGIGFENHGGQTSFIEDDAQPLAEVLNGYGNNTSKTFEGCIKYNVIGTYMHGSALPKNPELADWFINRIIEVKKKRSPSFKSADNIELENSIAELNNNHLKTIKFT